MTYGPAGNTFDKFKATNPISRRLMQGFTGSLRGLLDQTGGGSVLEVGCGEGYIQEMLAEPRFTQRHAFDIDYPIVVAAQQYSPTATYFVGNGETIPVPSKSFDISMAIEVLEHVPHPDKVLAEMVRVTRRYCILSVPREPIWRVLNMARGKYWDAMGNTPGHIQHWSSAAFVRQVSKHFEVIRVNQPLPWTMLLVKVRG